MSNDENRVFRRNKNGENFRCWSWIRTKFKSFQYGMSGQFSYSTITNLNTTRPKFWKRTTTLWTQSWTASKVSNHFLYHQKHTYRCNGQSPVVICLPSRPLDDTHPCRRILIVSPFCWRNVSVCWLVWPQAKLDSFPSGRFAPCDLSVQEGTESGIICSGRSYKYQVCRLSRQLFEYLTNCFHYFSIEYRYFILCMNLGKTFLRQSSARIWKKEIFAIATRPRKFP